MMIQVYTVFDKAVNAYLQPFYARSAGEAIRSFSQLANDPQSNVSRHPTDFVLFGLGAFDDNSGLFATSEPMRMIAANEVLNSSPFEETSGLKATGSNGRISPVS